jgi:hypothetical protein
MQTVQDDGAAKPRQKKHRSKALTFRPNKKRKLE